MIRRGRISVRSRNEHVLCVANCIYRMLDVYNGYLSEMQQFAISTGHANGKKPTYRLIYANMFLPLLEFTSQLVFHDRVSIKLDGLF